MISIKSHTFHRNQVKKKWALVRLFDTKLLMDRHSFATELKSRETYIFKVKLFFNKKYRKHIYKNECIPHKSAMANGKNGKNQVAQLPCVF